MFFVYQVVLLEHMKQSQRHPALKSTGLPDGIVLLLHDGIWFTCPEKRVTITRASQSIQKIIENSVRLSVPLNAELILQWQAADLVGT